MWCDNDNILSLTYRDRIARIKERFIDAGIIDYDEHDSSGKLKSAQTNSQYLKVLMPLLVFLKWNGDLRNICDALPQDAKNMTFVEFRNSLRLLGFQVQEMNMPFCNLDSRIFPCICLEKVSLSSTRINLVVGKENDSFICFDAYDEKFYNVDSQVGMVGQILCFSPIKKQMDDLDGHDQNQIKNAREKKKNLLDISLSKPTQTDISDKKKYNNYSFTDWIKMNLSRFKSILSLIVVYDFIIALLFVSIPVVLIGVYDQVFAKGNSLILAYSAIPLLFLSVFYFMFSLSKNSNLIWFDTRFSYLIGNLIMEKKLMSSMSDNDEVKFFHLNKTLDKFNKVDKVGAVNSLLSLVTISCLTVALFFLVETKVFLILLMITLSVLFLCYKAQQSVRKYHENEHQLSYQKDVFVDNAIEHLEDIRSAGAHGVWWNKLRYLTGALFYQNTKSRSQVIWLQFISFAMLALGLGVIIYQQIILSPQLNTGILISFALTSTLWILSTLKFRFFLINSANIGHYVFLLKDLYLSLKKFDIESDSLAQINSIPKFQGHITLSNVSVYINDPKNAILSNVSFEIKAGEIISLQGKLSSGKTTLIKLLLGYHKSFTGNILLDGSNLKQFDPVEFRKSISYISDDTEIFEGTVMNNLLMVNPLLSESEASKLLHEVGLLNDVISLEGGIHHYFSLAEIKNLSELFVFKLGFARALAKHSKILLIDHIPPSVLNNYVSYLKNYLLNNKGNITIIMAVNRKDLIEVSDRIIYIVNDREVIVGKTDRIIDLIEANESYKGDDYQVIKDDFVGYNEEKENEFVNYKPKYKDVVTRSEVS